jgi:hypothetical protein
MAMLVQNSDRVGSGRMRSGRYRRQARTRQELFHRACEVILTLAPTWTETSRAIVVVKDPRMTHAGVQAVFDEISEKFRVTDISLRFDEQEDGGIRAIFEPCHDLGPTLTRGRSALARSRAAT